MEFFRSLFLFSFFVYACFIKVFIFQERKKPNNISLIKMNSPRPNLYESERLVRLPTATTLLPGKDFIRVIAKHLVQATNQEVEHHYALPKSCARHCKLLVPLLDIAELDEKHQVDLLNGPITPVILPQSTVDGFEKVFNYLSNLLTCSPSMIARPLRNNLDESIQEWEISFLCSIFPKNKPHKSNGRFRSLPKKTQLTTESLDLLLEIAMLGDFLMIEPLCDLCCAYLAEIGHGAHSAEELMELWGRDTPLTEEELEVVYLQLPFLRASES